MSAYEPLIILVADDDEDDCLLIKEAISENKLDTSLFTVNDGEELMDYLYHRNKYQNHMDSPRPDLILLDLNMPRKDGREALQEIKNDDDLKKIPVVILTTSSTQDDILKTYKTGANSFITKPITFEGMVEVITMLNKYWFQIVKLPTE